jgi:long-chain fatty acid transport protein
MANSALASGFQLWEQNVTSVENFHAGRAALANDASVAYDNPAGIIRIKNQQVVAGGVGIFSNLQYYGKVLTCAGPNCIQVAPPVSGSVEGGSFSLIPDLHYVAPISPRVGFGFSIVAPYGQDLEYGQSSFVSSILTRARLQVIDLTPSLGVSITKKLSVGAGVDIEKMSGELNSIVPTPSLTASYPSISKGYDTAYGYHLGILYEFSEATRLGFAYHSKVSHHLKGTSNWVGAGPAIPGYFSPNPSRDLVNLELPADTTVSFYKRLNPQWAIMATLVYTQWNIVHDLVLQNVAGLGGKPVDYPMNFRNTITYSLGADFAASDKLTLRAGGGYDPTPTSNACRSLPLPDTDRYALAVGGHYQALKTLGFDLGWTHLFLKEGVINPPLHNNLLLQTVPQGKVKSSADVVGAQLTWDIV